MEHLVNKPKTKRGEATLNRLVTAAEQLFYEKGYHGASIHDITSLAEVALGTFYIYFDDKMSLYRYLLSQYSYRIRKHIVVSIGDEKNRKEAERIGLKSFLVFIQEHKHVYNIIWESLYIDPKLFVDYYTSFGENYSLQIKKAQENNQIKKEFDPEVVSFVLMGISNFIGLNWIMFKDENKFDDVVNHVIDILDKGLFVNE